MGLLLFCAGNSGGFNGAAIDGCGSRRRRTTRGQAAHEDPDQALNRVRVAATAEERVGLALDQLRTAVSNQ